MSFTVTIIGLLSKSFSGGIESLLDSLLATSCQHDSLRMSWYRSWIIEMLKYRLRIYRGRVVFQSKDEQTKVNFFLVRLR